LVKIGWRAHRAGGKISGIRGEVTERATFDNSCTTRAATREREGHLDGIPNGLVVLAAIFRAVIEISSPIGGFVMQILVTFVSTWHVEFPSVGQSNLRCRAFFDFAELKDTLNGA
jgi:hypothetical protein